MSDEIVASDQTPQEHSPKGQKMVIHMPQGAIIVERMDVGEEAQLVDVTNERARVDEHQILYRIAEMLDVITGRMDASEDTGSAGVATERASADEQALLLGVATERASADEQALLLGVATERASADEQALPLGVATERASADEHQILLRITEMLDVITERMAVYDDALSRDVTTERTKDDGHAKPVDVLMTDAEEGSEVHKHMSHGHHIDWTRHRHLDWMHVINIGFVAYIVLVATVPAVLSTYFGTAVYAAHSDSYRSSIHPGDLMVSKLTPVSKLKIDDVLLLRNEHTWKLAVSQVQVISTSSGSDLTTLTTESDSGAASRDTYTLKGATPIHKVTSIIPGIGHLSIVLASTLMKIGGALFLLVLNIFVQIRRARQRRFNRNI